MRDLWCTNTQSVRVVLKKAEVDVAKNRLAGYYERKVELAMHREDRICFLKNYIACNSTSERYVCEMIAGLYR